MRLSTRLALVALIFTLAACSGFGRRSSPSAAPAAATPAATAPAAAPATAPATAPAAAAATSPNPTYYKVTDVPSGKVFYTQKVNRSGSAVVFTDEKTGAETTLQSSQVLPVQKMEYTAGIAPTPTPAAPAAGASAGGAPAAAPMPDSK